MSPYKFGDWIRHRKSVTRYCVLSVHRNGQIVVESERGEVLLITRPEEYRAALPPESDAGGSTAKGMPNDTL
jgi:hypothetical protein